MRWFGSLRRNKQEVRSGRSTAEVGTTDMSVEETGVTWQLPLIVAKVSRQQEKFVTRLLKQARKQALTVEVGEGFVFKITRIPHGSLGLLQTMYGLAMRADEYGLEFGKIIVVGVIFKRIR